MIQTRYYAGGVGATAAPGLGRWEEIDSVAGTFTTWNISGVQTSQRTLTAAEIAALGVAAQVDNAATIRVHAQAALTANATFLALASPTAAQVATQAKALTRQVNGLLRLMLGQFQDVSDS